MITVKPFTIEVLSTHKAFFLLDELPKNSTEVDVWVQTPTGNESVDFIDVFLMKDGSLLAAWVHPYQKIPVHNLLVFANGATQILNLHTVENVIDIYDRPIDASTGTFIFCSSQIIENGDWRCDQSMYGPRPFAGEAVDRVITDIEEIVFYEPILNINGVGHLIYLESKTKTQLAVEKLNNSIVPVTGRTLQECFRLIYEWSVLAKQPFDSKDEAAVTAQKFTSELKFSEQEIKVLENLTPMQVGKFLSGSETARVRDMDILPLSDDVASILFRRMAASCLSFIVSLNPDIWDIQEIVSAEVQELEKGVARFKDYYQIPEGMEIEDNPAVIDHCFIYFPKQLSYVHTQLRGFKNKKMIIQRYEKAL